MRTKDDEIWMQVFRAALSGRANSYNPGLKGDADRCVMEAAEIADAAAPIMRARFAPKLPGTTFPAVTPEPLFTPLKRERAAKQAKDEADSSFGVVAR